MRKIINNELLCKIREEKIKDYFDFESLECNVALLSSIILSIIVGLCSYFTGCNATANWLIELSNSIAIAIIGLLGVIVSALAIMIGMISHKVAMILQKKNKVMNIERILLSFYFLGISCAFYVLISIFLKFISEIPLDAFLVGNVTVTFFVSYFIVFILFYTVKLIGNGLELFNIVNGLTILNDNNDEIKKLYKEKYISYRLMALEKVVFNIGSEKDFELYKSTIRVLIEKDNLSDSERDIMMLYFQNHFNGE